MILTRLALHTVSDSIFLFNIRALNIIIFLNFSYGLSCYLAWNRIASYYGQTGSRKRIRRTNWKS